MILRNCYKKYKLLRRNGNLSSSHNDIKVFCISILFFVILTCLISDSLNHLTLVVQFVLHLLNLPIGTIACMFNGLSHIGISQNPCCRNENDKFCRKFCCYIFCLCNGSAMFCCKYLFQYINKDLVLSNLLELFTIRHINCNLI